MRKLVTFCLAFLFVPTLSKKVIGQEFPGEGFNPNPWNIPTEAFENTPSSIPTSIDGFGEQPVGGYNPYQGEGSYGSLDFDYYNSNSGPNCGWVLGVEGRENSRYSNSTELLGKVEWHSNPCRDYLKIEQSRQSGQNTRAINGNLDTCLKLGEPKCPPHVRDRLLDKVLREIE